MNWNICIVEDTELDQLIEFNQPIELASHHPRIMPNAGVELHTESGRRYNAIYDGTMKAIRKLKTYNPQYKSFKNRDLALYNDHLLNEDVHSVVVDGFFGTGKTSTLCSHLVDGLVRELSGNGVGIPKAFISKPHVTMGNGYGFLPGDMHAKTDPEFASYYQYFDRFGQYGLANFLMMRDKEEQTKFTQEKMEGFDDDFEMSGPVLEILPFEYLLGRDIPEGWIVLDEAQNANEMEMANFISRSGDNAKSIIIGDSNGMQNHRKGNTPGVNGLTFAQEVFAGKSYAGFVEMQTVQHIIRGQRVRDLWYAMQARKS